ncbi:hypothetical protein F1559_002893 [Cyanidiococcus yangmingshanensis]|uniref:YqgF/RNase H-like domain-containing protein n=1 Tax=Cyanidiococcus yangmingshanensis TaxID=2690220 RepID=A0A7J7IMX6_9RHOD|nr:hypothetical protein F1559_002893 [Cyanidiococcus yangmingshanensis]
MSKVALLRCTQDMSRFATALDGRPGALLALDVGQRKVGIAISDIYRIVAFPLGTLLRQERPDHQRPCTLTHQLITTIAKYQAIAVVAGYPLELSKAREGAACSMVRTFLASLCVIPDQMESVCPNLTPPLPCLLWDERFSSSFARMYQFIDDPRRRGRTKRLPQWKKRGIDAYAALIILRRVLGYDWARYQTSPEHARGL